MLTLASDMAAMYSQTQYFLDKIDVESGFNLAITWVGLYGIALFACISFLSGE